MIRLILVYNSEAEQPASRWGEVSEVYTLLCKSVIKTNRLPATFVSIYNILFSFRARCCFLSSCSRPTNKGATGRQDTRALPLSNVLRPVTAFGYCRLVKWWCGDYVWDTFYLQHKGFLASHLFHNSGQLRRPWRLRLRWLRFPWVSILRDGLWSALFSSRLSYYFHPTNSNSNSVVIVITTTTTGSTERCLRDHLHLSADTSAEAVPLVFPFRSSSTLDSSSHLSTTPRHGDASAATSFSCRDVYLGIIRRWASFSVPFIELRLFGELIGRCRRWSSEAEQSSAGWFSQ